MTTLEIILLCLVILGIIGGIFIGYFYRVKTHDKSVSAARRVFDSCLY